MEEKYQINSSTRGEIITEYIEKLARKPVESDSLPPISEKIRLSVVIPAYNEESTIENVLKALKKQEVDHDFEVIVVDNTSTDNTRVIVEEFASHSPFPLYLLHETEPGAGNARKTGIDIVIRRVYQRDGKNVKRYIVAATDSDTIPGISWLQNISESFKHVNGSAAISGIYHASPEVDQKIEEALGLKSFLSKPAIITGYLSKALGLTRIRGPNFALEIECYSKAGGFTQPKDNLGNTSPGECYELSKRLFDSKYPIFHIDYGIVTNQRRHLYELINGINPQTTFDPTISRFLQIRDDENDLLTRALSYIPKSEWVNYMNQKLERIVSNILFYSLEEELIDESMLAAILHENFAIDLIKRDSIYTPEKLSSLWASVIVKEIEKNWF